MRRLAALSASLLACGCAGNQNVFAPAGPAAASIATLGWWLIGVCLVVYVAVMAALIWALRRERREQDEGPEAERRMARSVSLAVALTVIILGAFVVSSFVSGRGLTAPAGPGAITIDVIGQQWWWDFRYSDVTPSDVVSSPNELHLPVGVPVVLRAQSQDVIHSFWVPNLHGKRDLIPGQITHTWIQADRPGTYRGQCAEFCGHQHARMAFVVVAEPMPAFQAWIQHQRTAAAVPGGVLERRGQQLFLSSSCVMCHSVRGTPAGSNVGPELTHVASRRTLAAGTLPNTEEHLSAWVADPQAIKPGTRMPAAGLTRDDHAALVAYLRSLR